MSIINITITGPAGSGKTTLAYRIRNCIADMSFAAGGVPSEPVMAIIVDEGMTEQSFRRIAGDARRVVAIREEDERKPVPIAYDDLQTIQWHTDYSGGFPLDIHDHKGFLVARVSPVAGDEAARRIVACVNACECLPTELLTPESLIHANIKLTDVAAKCDELLAVLEDVRSALLAGERPRLASIEAAIAKGGCGMSTDKMRE